MTGIQTYTHLFWQMYSIYDTMQFLKAATNFTAFARHRLQQNCRVLFWFHHCIELLCNLCNAYVNALPHMTARMKIIEIPWQILHAPQIVRHHFTTKLPHALISRASIHRIWRMGQYIGKLMSLRQFQKSCHITFFYFFCFSAPWVAGKKLKRICIDFQRIFPHGQIPFRGRQMTSNMQHVYNLHSLTKCNYQKYFNAPSVS